MSNLKHTIADMSLQSALEQLSGASLPDDALIGENVDKLDGFDEYAEALHEAVVVDQAILTLESIRDDLSTMVENGEITEDGLTDIETQIYTAIDETSVEPENISLSTQSYVEHMGLDGAAVTVLHDVDALLTTMSLKSNSLASRIKGGFKDFFTQGADLVKNIEERALSARSEISGMDDWETGHKVAIKDSPALSIGGSVNIPQVCANMKAIAESQIKDAKFQRAYIASLPKAVDFVLRRSDDKDFDQKAFAKAIDLNPGKPFETSRGNEFRNVGGFDNSNKNVEGVSMDFWEAPVSDAFSFFINTPNGRGTYTIDARAMKKRSAVKQELPALSRKDALTAIDSILNLIKSCPDATEANRIYEYTASEVKKIMNNGGGYRTMNDKLGGLIDEDSRKVIDKEMGHAAPYFIVFFLLVAPISAGLATGFVVGGTIGRVVREKLLNKTRALENVLMNSLLSAMASFYKQLNRTLKAIIQYVDASTN